MIVFKATDFTEWRTQARQLLRQGIEPSQVCWLEEQPSLFEELSDPLPVGESLITALKVSKIFIRLAEQVAYHRSSQKWQLLYTALWRMLNGEKHLLALTTDSLVYELLRMQKAVSRDAHKMKAFVRFKLYKNGEDNVYLAWYQPDHLILQLVAPFFQRRFSVMHWLIMTPDGAAGWDGQQLRFEKRLLPLQPPIEDTMDNLWQIYYRSIFNPARIKLKAMRREMPVRYWQHMPETRIITQMLQEAPARVKQMLQYQEGFTTSADDYLPAQPSISNLCQSAANCQGCNLYQNAKQVVFGKGPATAQIMLIGEQPGHCENEQGTPFVGPAGQLLNQLLAKAGLNREELYLTNAVKHFKHKWINGKAIHVSPGIAEINACKPWLLAEIKTIQPKLIICLGLTAAKSLISPGFHIKQQRGEWLKFAANQQILVTYHPSAILRAKDLAQQQSIYQTLLQDLSKVSQGLEQLASQEAL